MNEITYPWQRYWMPGTSTAGLPAPADYFIPPTGAAALEHWQATPCLVLVGEPGMGKSAEWQRQLATTPTSSFLNLGDFSSGKQIRKAIQRLPAVQYWQQHPGTDLWLWLDSFDEALLHEAKLVQALLRLLAEWPTTGLHLRLLCRTATWPDYFTKELRRYFGREQAVEVLQLAPLTRQQVRQAAEAHTIDTEAFETAVERAEAVALASLPVTLGLLLRLWQAGEFTAAAGRGIELLEKGCRLLCAENWDPTRSTYQQADPERRFRLAAQLALLMVGSGRQQLTDDETDNGRQRLRLRDVTDEPLLFADKAAPIPDHAAVRELVEHCGLFVATATGSRWVHPVFADYLAAWALHQAAIPPAQLRNLLRAEAPEAGLVLALRDLGVWLAALSPTFATDLIQLDPLTAIRADVVASTDAQRTDLTERLLELTAARHFYPQRAEAYLSRLAHPGLATQLEEVLRQPGTPIEAQWLAYKIAASCRVCELVPLLLQQALDATLLTSLRTEALKTLHALASLAECRPLRSLLANLPADDQDDEFRGWLLRLLWPQEMTVRELLPLLSARRNTSFYGAYHFFLDPASPNGLRAGLTPAALPTLIYWLVRRPNRALPTANHETIKAVRTSVLRVGWETTADSRTLAWLALGLRRWITRHEVAFIPTQALPRHRVLARWVQRRQLPAAWDLTYLFPAGYVRAGQDATSRQSLVDTADIEFVLDQLRQTTHLATTDRLFGTALQLLHRLAANHDPTFQTNFAALYTLATTRNLDAGRDWVWELEEEATQYFRNSHLEEQRAHQEQNRRARQQNRRARQAQQWNRRTPYLLWRLTDPTRSNPVPAWRYARWLLLRSGNGQHNPYQIEVTGGFAWQLADPRLQTRLTDLAWRVMQVAPPQLPTRQPHNSFATEQAVPLAALLLCQTECPQRLANWPAAAWQPWLRAILYGFLAEEQRRELFAVARLYHRRTVLRQVTGEADFWAQLTAESHGYVRLNQLLREIPDPVLWRLALGGVMRGHWPLSFSQQVLAQLLQLGFRPAELFREALFTQARTAPTWHILTFTALRTELEQAASAATWWPAWQRLLGLGLETARVLLQRLDGTPSWIAPLPADLSDEQLSELLRWSVLDLGISEENGPDDWRHHRRGRVRLRTFRNTIAKRLAERATPVAWNALRELAEQLAYPSWLAYHVDEARETYSRRSWQAPAPAQLLDFLRHAARRWPQSSADVLDLVLESLDRLQARLQGEPARAQDLWQQVAAQTGYRIVRGNKVVIENRVTDYVQGFLNDDLERHLFSTQREVQLRAAAGGQRGQELDLYVQAVPLDTQGRPRVGERLLVFIEAKHHDNSEVATALQAQLVNRYLRQHEARTGLFLVYWHKPGAANELAALRQQLSQQAAQASADGLLLKSYVLDIRLPDDQL